MKPLMPFETTIIIGRRNYIASPNRFLKISSITRKTRISGKFFAANASPYKFAADICLNGQIKKLKLEKVISDKMYNFFFEKKNDINGGISVANFMRINFKKKIKNLLQLVRDFLLLMGKNLVEGFLPQILRKYTTDPQLGRKIRH